MAYTTGLSKEGKHIVNTSKNSWETIKSKMSEEDLIKFDENMMKETKKMMKQVNNIMR